MNPYNRETQYDQWKNYEEEKGRRKAEIDFKAEQAKPKSFFGQFMEFNAPVFRAVGKAVKNQSKKNRLQPMPSYNPPQIRLNMKYIYPLVPPIRIKKSRRR